MPKTFERYFEPFLGAGALFFELQPKSAILSDSNPELINCYLQVRDNPGQVITRLARLANSEAEFYRVRSQTPTSDLSRAARLIYLTTLAFNGIYRVNARGDFNVPYNLRSDHDHVQANRIRRSSQALQGADLRCRDFEAALESARPRDLVYLDPPYTVAHGNNGFLRYNSRIFSWRDQTRLAATAETLRKRGCFIILTNAHHPSITKLYARFAHLRVSRSSRVAASVQHRRNIHELIVTNVV